LEGLPSKLGAFLFNFTEKEIFEDTDDVLNVLITMYDSKGDGQKHIVNELPSAEEFKAEIE
jgi:serine/threonine protein kinase